MEIINALGRRKTAVARVYMSKGSGKIVVNKKEMKVMFPIDVLQGKINQPFILTDTVGQFDIKVNVMGGGINGQAEAIRSLPLYPTPIAPQRTQTRTERRNPGRPK